MSVGANNFFVSNEILIATGNDGKFKELSEIMKPFNIKCISPKVFNISEPEETGKTFAENSLIKSKYYAQKSGKIALADDSGLCISDLDSLPGINSARFAINPENQKRDFDYAFKKIYNQLASKNINLESKPKAYFICNLTIYNPFDQSFHSFEGRVDGYISVLPKGQKGFGYDPIFIKDGMNQTFAEIDQNLKDLISHRGDAAKKLAKYLNAVL